MAKAPAIGDFIVSSTRHGFSGEPLETGGKCIGKGDSDDLGKFVRVPRANRDLDLGVAPGARLHRDLDLLRRFAQFRFGRASDRVTPPASRY
jgi:hypothetical protein